MPAFTYIDRHPTWTKDTDWYTSTNEVVPTHQKDIAALIGTGKDHIASICSGGDLPIMMIPFTKQSMQIVDHAKKSMVWAMLKVILLEQLGAERCKKLMTGPWEDFDALAKPLLTLLPGDIAACYYNANLGYASDKGWGGIQNVWKQLTLPELAAAVHHLHKMTFIHGDFNLDLVSPEGGFDAAYVSNMHGHSGRSGAPDWNLTLNLVKVGAPILGTTYTPNTVATRVRLLTPYLALERLT
jgi:hypothetical protein